ncbi:MAG: dCTP deaminase domain-containing protein [Alphaproteobacteria bacterium]
MFQNAKCHKKELYWEKLKIYEKKLVIKKNNFYILKSKEKIQIPKNMAGEMVPYDTNIGDFRVHYAGFF